MCDPMYEALDRLPRRHRHLGVYGLCIAEGEVLLIQKARGPYKGLLDLPGGGIEFGEEPDTALRREFMEETGLEIDTASLRDAASRLVRHRSDDGVEEDLYHIGLIYDVSLVGDDMCIRFPKSYADGEDSGGAEWIALRELGPDSLAPFAELAISGL